MIPSLISEMNTMRCVHLGIWFFQMVFISCSFSHPPSILPCLSLISRISSYIYMSPYITQIMYILITLDSQRCIANIILSQVAYICGIIIIVVVIIIIIIILLYLHSWLSLNKLVTWNYTGFVFLSPWPVLNDQQIRELYILRPWFERYLEDLQYVKLGKKLGIISTIHFALHYNQFFSLRVDRTFSPFHNGLQLK